jgi:hypothetical protein
MPGVQSPQEQFANSPLVTLQETGGLLAKPLFLVACERSGTTLLSLILDHHPQLSFVDCYYSIEKLGDDGDWPEPEEYYRFLETNFIFQDSKLAIDKTLDYPHLVDSFLRQVLIRSGKPLVGGKIRDNYHRVLSIWPDARFIHLLRDGRDVAHSIIGMGWAGNTYLGAEYWLHAEQLWDKLRDQIPPDRWIEIRYETLVNEPEATLDQVCQFIGVPYSPAMLDFPTDTTYSAPAPEHVGQWKRKLAPREIQLAEARIGTMLVRRDYALSEHPPLLVSPALERRLRLQDRWFRAMFRRRRYGTSLFVADYLARRIGTRKWQARIQNDINNIIRKHLK